MNENLVDLMERYNHNERMTGRKSEQSREVKQQQIQEKSPDYGSAAVALAAASMNANEIIDIDDVCNSRAFHKQFVEAIFVKGISDATPSLITSKMQMKPPELTSERIKSHLQKFRKNQQREKGRFLEDYDKWLDMIEEEEAAAGNLFTKSLTGAADGGGGGSAVAFLAYAVRKEQQQEEKNERGEHGYSSATSGRNPKRQKRQEMDVKEAEEYVPTSSDTVVGFGDSNSRMGIARKIPLPALTEKEKSTGLGRSFLFICSLAQQMSQHIEHQRQMLLNPNDDELDRRC